MKKLLGVGILALLLPVASLADGPGRGGSRPGDWDRQPDRDGWIQDGNDLFMPVRYACDVRHLQVRVENDDVRILDLKVKYANNRIPYDVTVRANFREGSGSEWKELRPGQNGCIIGIRLSAEELRNDHDRRSPVVRFFGRQLIRPGIVDTVELGRGIVVRDYNDRRNDGPEWLDRRRDRRGPGAGPGRRPYP